MLKIFVITPRNIVDELIEAMADAGAGVIGKYTHNAYVTEGIGHWKNELGTNPTVGKVGETMSEPESKIEMVCEEDKLDKVLIAVKRVHSYETPAIDVIQLYEQN